MFINNNCASFHLWWMENLVKHQKVSEYYENGCRRKNGNQDSSSDLVENFKVFNFMSQNADSIKLIELS